MTNVKEHPLYDVAVKIMAKNKELFPILEHINENNIKYMDDEGIFLHIIAIIITCCGFDIVFEKYAYPSIFELNTKNKRILVEAVLSHYVKPFEFEKLSKIIKKTITE